MTITMYGTLAMAAHFLQLPTILLSVALQTAFGSFLEMSGPLHTQINDAFLISHGLGSGLWTQNVQLGLSSCAATADTVIKKKGDHCSVCDCKGYVGWLQLSSHHNLYPGKIVASVISDNNRPLP